MVAGIAYAAVQAEQNGLYRIDLNTGASFFVGLIGTIPDPLILRELTMVPESASWALWSVPALLGFAMVLRRRVSR